jgi:SAM-dependent methyltransferase
MVPGIQDRRSAVGAPLRLDCGASRGEVSSRTVARDTARGTCARTRCGWDVEFHRTPFRKAGYANFLTQDIAEYDGKAPDYLGDICAQTNIPDEIAGCCLAFNLLEHVYAPWAAVDEILRVLRPEGVFFGSVPLRVHIHRWDRDYWRFCPDGIAYLLRHFRMVHFALDGNASLPANLLWAAVKDPGKTEWWEHNQEVVSRPEVIIGNDYLTPSPVKRRVLDLMRARFRLTLDRWDEPTNPERMRELGFVDWTVVDYRDARATPANFTHA